MSLSLLIVLHELGHFIPARLFKTRVEKFYLFFDIKYSLFKKKIGETVYGIGWLPLGGYVKISGMIDESMDKEQMALPPQPWEFRSKPAWQRLIIMLGGVFVNVLVGFIIYIGLTFFVGEDKATGADFKYGFGFPKVMEEVGFQQGDQPLLVDNDTLQLADKLVARLVLRDVKTVTVLRDGKKVTLDMPEDIGNRLFKAGVKGGLDHRFPFVIDSIKPGSIAEKLEFPLGAQVTDVAGYKVKYNTDLNYAMNHIVNDTIPFNVTLVAENGQKIVKEVSFEDKEKKPLGIYRGSTEKDIVDIERLSFTFFESVSKGFSRGYWTMHDYIAQFSYVFTKEGASQLGGFGTIAKLYPDTWDWANFWNTTAFISFILAIMNILPIPALDGGHVAFLLYEMITGRKPGDKFLERAQLVGIFLLLALMLYANGNDLFKWLSQYF